MKDYFFDKEEALKKVREQEEEARAELIKIRTEVNRLNKLKKYMKTLRSSIAFNEPVLDDMPEWKKLLDYCIVGELSDDDELEMDD